MIGKKAQVPEELAKMIRVLVVLLVVLGILYILLKPLFSSLINIEDKNTNQGDDAVDQLSKAFGQGCEPDGREDCDPLTHKVKVCQNGVWKPSEKTC